MAKTVFFLPILTFASLFCVILLPYTYWTQLKSIQCPICDETEVLICPKSISELFEFDRINDLEKEGFLAASSLNFCSKNPFVKFMVNEDKSLNQLYFEGESYVEKFLRNTYFLLHCILKFSAGHSRYEIYTEKTHCPTLKR